MADQEDADRREPEGDGDDELRAALGDLLASGGLGEDQGDDDVDDGDVERRAPAAERQRVDLDDHFDLSALEDAVAELGIEVEDEPTAAPDEPTAAVEPSAPAGEPSTPDAVEPSAPSTPSSPRGRHVGLDLTELPSPPGRPASPPVDHDDEPAPFEFSSSEPMPFLISADEVDDEPQRPAREPALPGKGPSATAGLPPEDVDEDPEPTEEPAPTGRKMPPLGQASAADLFGEEEDDGWEPIAPGALGSRGSGDEAGRPTADAAEAAGDAEAAEAAGDAEAGDEAEGRRTRGRGRRGFSLRRGRGAREAASAAPDELDDDATPALGDPAEVEHERLDEVDARDDEHDRPDEVAAPDDERERLDEVAARAEVDQVARGEAEAGRYDAPLRVEDEPAEPGPTDWGTPPDDWDDLDLGDDEAEATPDVDRPAAAPTTEEVVAFAAHRGRLSGDVSTKARKLFGR